MIENREGRITVRDSIYGDRVFTGIRRLGFAEGESFVIDTWTTPDEGSGRLRGSYFTCVPISPMKYRRQHRTGAAFRLFAGRLDIYSDHGARTIIRAPKDILEHLAADCVAHEIPDRAAEGTNG